MCWADCVSINGFQLSLQTLESPWTWGSGGLQALIYVVICREYRQGVYDSTHTGWCLWFGDRMVRAVSAWWHHRGRGRLTEVLFILPSQWKHPVWHICCCCFPLKAIINNVMYNSAQPISFEKWIIGWKSFKLCYRMRLLALGWMGHPEKTFTQTKFLWVFHCLWVHGSTLAHKHVLDHFSAAYRVERCNH